MKIERFGGYFYAPGKKTPEHFSGSVEYLLDGRIQWIDMNAPTLELLKRKLAWYVWRKWLGYKMNDCLM